MGRFVVTKDCGAGEVKIKYNQNICCCKWSPKHPRTLQQICGNLWKVKVISSKSWLSSDALVQNVSSILRLDSLHYVIRQIASFAVYKIFLWDRKPWRICSLGSLISNMSCMVEGPRIVGEFLHFHSLLFVLNC